MKTLNYIGMAVGITAFTLAWIWFSWKLALIIFLALAGNNMERNGRK